MVDASVLVNAPADDTEVGDAARARLLDVGHLQPPHLVDLEVLSVVRSAVTARKPNLRRAQLALDDPSDLRLTRYRHAPSAQRVGELRRKLTPCDAPDVALAEAPGYRLVTADDDLARVPGLPCEVGLLG